MEVWSGNKAGGVAGEWAQQGQMEQGERQKEAKLLLDRVWPVGFWRGI